MCNTCSLHIYNNIEVIVSYMYLYVAVLRTTFDLLWVHFTYDSCPHRFHRDSPQYYHRSSPAGYSHRQSTGTRPCHRVRLNTICQRKNETEGIAFAIRITFIFMKMWGILIGLINLTFKLLYKAYRNTDKSSVPEKRIWSILGIKSESKWCINLSRRQKGGDMTQSYDKSPYTNRNVKRAKRQHKQRQKKFD